MSVTPNYFAVLGIAPQLGRTFPVENRSPGYLGEIVISDGLWKGDFGGDPHILHKSIRRDTDLYRIVGVMPPSFHAPGRTVDERKVEVWAATSFYGPPLSYQPPRRVRNIPGAIARLTPDLTLTAAQGRIDALVADLRRQYSADYPDRKGRGADVAQAPVVDGSVVTPEYFHLLGMTALRGRLFTAFDSETTPAVAVINEAMARTFWPNVDPIGAHVKLSRSPGAWTTIVGIIADARTETLADPGVPQI